MKLSELTIKPELNWQTSPSDMNILRHLTDQSVTGNSRTPLSASPCPVCGRSGEHAKSCSIGYFQPLSPSSGAGKTLSGQRLLKMYQMGNLHQHGWDQLAKDARDWWNAFAEEIERIVVAAACAEKDKELESLRESQKELADSLKEIFAEYWQIAECDFGDEMTDRAVEALRKYEEGNQ